MALYHSRLGLENKSGRIFCVRQVNFTKSCQKVWGRVNQPFIHRIHKWRTRGKKLVPSHESEALEGKQKLQMKTFSELAECLARIPPKITLYGLLFKSQSL